MSLFGNKNRECPSCALESDSGHEECPYCGYEFPESSKGQTVMALLFLLLMLLWLLTAIF
ncbi:hypothetical protein QLX67_11845 [Balneolaceae bacterium ANBcel3]|nr:hypothetical protein [Balneolaceae bacterium ANBcel3]